MSPASTERNDGQLSALRKGVTEAIARRQYQAARGLCDELEQVAPLEPDSWVFRARIAQRQNAFIEADKYLAEALERAPSRWDVGMVAAEGKIYVGEIDQALIMLRKLNDTVQDNAAAMGRLAALFTQLERHAEAAECAVRARKLEPQSLNWALLEASTAIPVGDLERAERLMDQVIAASPDETDIYYNRSVVAKQSLQSNHIDELRQLIRRRPENDPRVVPLWFALGKELEDLEDYPGSFAAFASGARIRRQRLSYDVSTDEQVMLSVAEAFDADWFSRTRQGRCDEAPVFVLGLPRSGTTLVDRILSTHRDVISLGEVNDVAYAVTRFASPARDKLQLIAQSANVDVDQLGQSIIDAFRGYGEEGSRLLDKTPANYLYLGLLAKALPNASFVHVHRHPLASGFAMFKTLFRMGYPFSYDQSDLARYYIAYRGLMDHWDTTLGDRITHISYEALVDDQEAVSRQLFEACGLEWNSASLEFHKNATATATASAAQVRQPIYRTARDLWRHHEGSLKPMKDALMKAGIDV